MDPLAADLALAEAAAARQRTRTMLRVIRLPIRLAGVVDLVGALVVLLIGRDHALLYFGPAFVALLVISSRHYRAEGRRSGMQLPILPWALILLPMVVVASVLSRLGFALDMPSLTLIGPFLANAAATAVVAAWLRSRRLAVTAIAMPVVSVCVVALLDGDVAGAACLTAYGVLLLASARRETL